MQICGLGLFNFIPEEAAYQSKLQCIPLISIPCRLGHIAPPSPGRTAPTPACRHTHYHTLTYPHTYGCQNQLHVVTCINMNREKHNLQCVLFMSIPRKHTTCRHIDNHFSIHSDCTPTLDVVNSWPSESSPTLSCPASPRRTVPTRACRRARSPRHSTCS